MSSLVENTNVKAIYTNEDYEPYAQRRDERVHEVLGRLGKPLHTFTDHVIQAPGEVVGPDGSPYTVSTPYSKRWHANLTEVLASPSNCTSMPSIRAPHQTSHH